MVIFPDRDPLAAQVLFGMLVDNPQSSDAVRAWGDSRSNVEKRLADGEIAAMIHDGLGTREAVEPNRNSWLLVCSTFRDASRGVALHRFDGPTPAAARAAIEKAQIEAECPMTIVVDPIGTKRL